MKKYLTVIELINKWIFNFIAVVFAFVSLLTIYQVFARFVLKSPLVWSEAVVRYLMIWIVLLGMAIALKKGLLISVEILLYVVPRKIQRIMKLTIIIINVIFLSLLVKYGVDMVGNLAHHKTGTINIPVSWIYAAIPVGSLFALFNCIAVGIELILNKDEEGEKDGTTIVH